MIGSRAAGRSVAAVLLLLMAACGDSPTAAVEVRNAEPRQGEAWIPGGGGECDPWLDINWCQPRDPGGPCIEGSAPSGVDGQENCKPDGPGEGDQVEPLPSDTCHTGDPVLESPAVQQGLSDLWQQSNPEKPMEERVERGGWIVPDGYGAFKVQPFKVVSNNACEILIDPRTRPLDAVAFVHTHPYESGVPIRVCEGEMILGRLVHQTYMNEPSDFDGQAASTLKLPGYIIDYDKITKFHGDRDADWGFTIENRHNRCGY